MKKIRKYIFGVISILSIILISVLIYSKFENENKKITDSEKFKSEYPNVSKDNLFVYKNSNEIIKILRNGEGVIFMGFKECKWCQAYAPILDKAAKESGIKKIYYLNIYEERKNNSLNYQTIIKILEDQLLYDDEGNKRIFVPDVTIVKNGEIIGHDNESSIILESTETPETYWTEERKNNLEKKLKEYFKRINTNTCTSCN